MIMSNQNKSRFRIKWADREVEYYGDEATTLYKDIIEYVKSIPISAVIAKTAPLESQPSHTTDQSLNAKNKELQLISKDCGVSTDQLSDILQFNVFEGFQEEVPHLPKHPEEENAALLVCYALQVGLQKQWLEVAYIKDILTQVNGYPLPGRKLGRILESFRNKKWTITSQTKGRYKSFCLSSDGGLAAARDCVKELKSVSV